MTPAETRHLERTMAALSVASRFRELVCIEVPGRSKNITNQRGHWAKKSKPAGTWRSRCKAAVEVELAGEHVKRMAKFGGFVLLTRVGTRRLDDDGATAAVKSARDGVADALRTGDGINGLVAWLPVAQEVGSPKVRIRIWADAGWYENATGAHLVARPGDAKAKTRPAEVRTSASNGGPFPAATGDSGQSEKLDGWGLNDVVTGKVDWLAEARKAADFAYAPPPPPSTPDGRPRPADYRERMTEGLKTLTVVDPFRVDVKPKPAFYEWCEAQRAKKKTTRLPRVHKAEADAALKAVGRSRADWETGAKPNYVKGTK